VIGAAMRPMWVEVTWKLLKKALGRCQTSGISKGLRKKATSHSKHCLYYLVCIFAYATTSLLLLIIICTLVHGLTFPTS
jgi:hypothetical protein